jgi:hypothetical protein
MAPTLHKGLVVESLPTAKAVLSLMCVLCDIKGCTLSLFEIDLHACLFR